MSEHVSEPVAGPGANRRFRDVSKEAGNIVGEKAGNLVRKSLGFWGVLGGTAMVGPGLIRTATSEMQGWQILIAMSLVLLAAIIARWKNLAE